MSARRVRRSLLLELLALAVVVAATSVAVTAWLTVRTTAVALHEEQGRTLADEAHVYDVLLGYAATHSGWSGAQPLVDDLARATGYRIVVTTTDRAVLLDSAPAGLSATAASSTAPAPLPSRPLATLDPLAVDTDLADQAAVGVADSRPTDDGQARACPREGCPPPEPSRTTVTLQGPDPVDPRVVAPADARATLADLTDRTNTCLSASGGPTVSVLTARSWTQQSPRTDATDRAVAACLDQARHDQLAPSVAPPALLFVAAPRAAATTFLDLSPANRTRIALVAALVLLVTLAVAAAVGTRMVRPLRRLAAAADGMGEGDLSVRAPVRGSDEIARVATAFNTMAERRERLEAQRTALMNDVAHELRTPLSNVRGWLEAAQDGLVRPDDDVLTSLLDETLLLQRIVDDLHDLALADAGALPLHPEPVEVDVLLEQVAAAHAARAQQSGVSLSVDATPAHVHADPVRLRQVVGNLVSNALRHTAPGGTVTLRSRREPGAPDGTVLVEVADTGTGIAPQDLPHVFDRFWRADTSRTRGTGGTGLGLAIVRDLVRSHGGTVEAVSTPGRGTTMRVRLPTATPEPGVSGT